MKTNVAIIKTTKAFEVRIGKTGKGKVVKAFKFATSHVMDTSEAYEETLNWLYEEGYECFDKKGNVVEDELYGDYWSK